jgi:hypothetical protein
LVQPAAFSRLRGTAVLVGTLGGAGLLLGSGLLPVPCPFKLLTGLSCPFCGGSRMIGALLHGDLDAAVHLNAFALLVLGPLLAWFLLRTARHELGRHERVWPAGMAGRLLGVGLVVLTLTWTVVRNLPMAPFTAFRA